LNNKTTEIKQVKLYTLRAVPHLLLRTEKWQNINTFISRILTGKVRIQTTDKYYGGWAEYK
jgi:hypothetical protein